jgi:hypothetical protein
MIHKLANKDKVKRLVFMAKIFLETRAEKNLWSEPKWFMMWFTKKRLVLESQF